MEGIGSFVASIGNAIYEGIKKLIEAIINACKAIGRFISGLLGKKGEQTTGEKINEVQEKARKEAEKHRKLREDLEKLRKENTEKFQKTLDELNARAGKDGGGEKSGGRNEYEGPEIIKKIRKLKEKQDGTRNAEDAKVVTKDPLDLPKRGDSFEKVIDEVVSELKNLEDRDYSKSDAEEFIDKHLQGTTSFPPYLHFAEHIVSSSSESDLTKAHRKIFDLLKKFDDRDYLGEDLEIATGKTKIEPSEKWELAGVKEGEKYRITPSSFPINEVYALEDSVKKFLKVEGHGNDSIQVIISRILSSVNENIHGKNRAILVDLTDLPDSKQHDQVLHSVKECQGRIITLLEQIGVTVFDWNGKLKALKSRGEPTLEVENHLKNISTILNSLNADLASLNRAIFLYTRCRNTVLKSVSLIESATQFISKSNEDHLEKVAGV